MSLEHLKTSDLNHRQLYRYRVSVLASALNDLGDFMFRV